ncbi:hypothetical protein CBI38_31080 (plasmid) [Rhodococcus oxybenzonivorans]|uniref:Uncharacterized protein n=1 Tax=Rhodococcus oxybenzonivorans TaxID=1990687 RepID=A0A2S2C5G7_9NOCA|nr:hypothetical protein CBI38_31080 [Rhodococcus oxybenzonivorans]
MGRHPRAGGLFAARAGDDAGEAPVDPFRADGPGAAAVVANGPRRPSGHGMLLGDGSPEPW